MGAPRDWLKPRHLLPHGRLTKEMTMTPSGFHMAFPPHQPRMMRLLQTTQSHYNKLGKPTRMHDSSSPIPGTNKGGGAGWGSRVSIPQVAAF